MSKPMFSVILFALAGFVFLLMHQFSVSNWQIAYEQQAYLRCLPYEISLVNKTPPNEVSRGDLVVVSTSEYPQYYRDGVELLKLIMGVPGDKISITEDVVTINDEVIAYLGKAGRPFEPAFKGVRVLKDGEYWISGVSNVSIDSRYIGPISHSSILGKAYAIF